MDTVWPIDNPPISAREAPADFAHGLPERPPTLDETHQLVELWDNVEGMARLRWSEWGKSKRCEYMVWFLKDGREYRVWWDSKEEIFQTQQRTALNSCTSC
jgi:hypothetical protein